MDFCSYYSKYSISTYTGCDIMPKKDDGDSAPLDGDTPDDISNIDQKSFDGSDSVKEGSSSED